MKFQLTTLPNKPGIYQYLNSEGKVIYVGKAKNLKKRVASYFTKKHENNKTAVLVRQIDDIQTIVVNSEIEALLLENNLIKKYQPKYNVLLKDDKTYPWICIKKEPFSRVFSTRDVIRDGSEYFGPYASVKMMNTILKLLHQLFPIRSCSLNLSSENIKSKKFKECLEYHIGNCLAPCIGRQTLENYQANLFEIKNILKGNINGVITHLKKKKVQYSDALEFEKAQELKEKIETLEKYQSKSIVVSPSINDVDVFSIVSDEKSAFVNYLRIVNGAIVQGQTIEFRKKMNETDDELLQLGIIELRLRYDSSSTEIIVPFIPSIKDESLSFFVPQIGDKKKLLELSVRNAIYFRLEKLKQQQNTSPTKHSDRILEQLRKDLRMNVLPTHIECFDNSNIHGNYPVSACVVFKDAKPSKKEYRHYNIKTVEGPNDFASMEEVVFRRYERMLAENQSLPHLIIIDGGKGQLSSALKSIDSLNLRGKITVIGIAKKLEEIYFPNDSVPLYISKKSESLKLIQYLRNEAHRFGITHHRNRRSKEFIKTELHEIEGIGEKSIKDLLTKFKSVERIKMLDILQLEKVIGKKRANFVFQHFNSFDK